MKKIPKDKMWCPRCEAFFKKDHSCFKQISGKKPKLMPSKAPKPVPMRRLPDLVVPVPPKSKSNRLTAGQWAIVFLVAALFLILYLLLIGKC
jgi:hypothetical protein